MQNKIVVITGAGGRLGQVMVERYRSQGATLITVDRQAPEDQALAFSADLTDEAAVERAFGQIAGAVERIDALVHVVGTWGMSPLLETSLADWNKMMDLNLTTAFLVFREAARLMAERGGGRIIGVAASQGVDQGKAQQAAYGAAKAGIVRLIESIADEFEDQNITTHAIAPSTILFGDEDTGTEGVTAEALADLCAYLIGPAGDIHNGTTIKAYG